MIPEFLLSLDQPHRTKELEYLCSFVTDWTKMESNIWVALLDEVADIIGLVGNDRLSVKFFLKSNVPIGTEGTIGEKILPILTKFSTVDYSQFNDIFRSIVYRDLKLLDYHIMLIVNLNWRASLARFLSNLYHIVIREIINHHDKKNYPFQTPLVSINVFQAAQLSNQIAQHAWSAVYTITENRQGILCYKNPIFKFESQEDLILFKLMA